LTLQPERRRQLQLLGLRALLRQRFGAAAADAARPVHLVGGVLLVAPVGAGGEVAAMFADQPAALGAAVDGAAREGAERLFFFCESSTPELARRAAQFRLPTVVVVPGGEFEPLAPAPAPVAAPLPYLLVPVVRRLERLGLDVVWEDDVVVGEWRGLEIVRAAIGRVGESTGVVVEAGVGRHDREANRLLHPDGPDDTVITTALATVAALRRAGAPAHPANQLVPERWLRTILRARPGLVGFAALATGPAPGRRETLRDRGVAPLWGLDGDGRPTVVVCSVGIDPDLVALAADARACAPGWPGVPPALAAHPDGWELVVVVPEGDDHPLTRRLVGLLRRPAEVLTVPAGWRDLGT